MVLQTAQKQSQLVSTIVCDMVMMISVRIENKILQNSNLEKVQYIQCDCMKLVYDMAMLALCVISSMSVSCTIVFGFSG